MSTTILGILALSLLLVPLAFAFGCERNDTETDHSDASDKAAPKLSSNMSDKNESAAHSSHKEHPPNRLADETSLYLLLHSHNPVDWYPWGEEAFSTAAQENKLVFLSIGYSSCYWCHVMERESFMDNDIAAALNEHFVSIKVDREERPDVDQIYMTALQIYFRLTGSPRGGGWPLTMFLTPDGRPIMGGTYFPPHDRNGQTGLAKVLELVQQAWEEKPQQLGENADVLATLVRRQLEEHPAPSDDTLDESLLRHVQQALRAEFDPEWGGFGYNQANPRYPKFPQPSSLLFLLDQVRRFRDEDREAANEAETMLLLTIEKMAAGGIWDHVGGGFHRYSTDRFWAVPHFEKMLYDNAQLATVYAEAYALTGRMEFRRTAEAVCDFVLREMTDERGGFFAAIDAETDGEEGRYYVWTANELSKVLDDEQWQLAADVYGLNHRPNFEGRYVLLADRSLACVAAKRNLTADQLHTRFDGINAALLRTRNARKRPLTDTKVLTSWSGLMIRGLADTGRILDNPHYTEAAARAAHFVLENLRTPEGRLLRTFGAGRAHLNAYLDDYAFLVDGLLSLHRATNEPQWLDEAQRLTDKQIELFADQRAGGFFFTTNDHEKLIARSKDPTDSALPSGNAVAAGNLIYLAQALERPEYLALAEKTLRAFAPQMEPHAVGMPRMAVSLAAWLDAK